MAPPSRSCLTSLPPLLSAFIASHFCKSFVANNVKHMLYFGKLGKYKKKQPKATQSKSTLKAI